MCVFVAVSEGYVVGTVACAASGEEGHLRGMAVLPDWQGSGVASALLQAAEAEIRNQHCKRVTLDTTEPLARAVRFYARHGFRLSGRVSDFFGMPLHEWVKFFRGKKFPTDLHARENRRLTHSPQLHPALLRLSAMISYSRFT